ncbi:proton-conducting transporter membrane subunit [Actinophytocola sp.]|uniref:proton-conducting transporter transmembrane domain-containing protein n=1 Tax=Actinophytocola sp. TaxID=1872138 RepID=UPI0025C023B0|nr:proton-conducting transporter membrane subunit [Actinophytocola sp.]
MTWVLLSGLGLLGVALLADLVLGVRHAWARPLPYLLGTAASVLLTVTGAAGLAGHGARVGLDAFLGFGAASLTVDRLSALFLVVCFAVAAPVSLACAGWAARSPQGPHRIRARGLGCAYALTLASVAVVVTADHVFVFLFAWESLTLDFYLLTAHHRREAAPAVVTVVLGKASGAALLVGFLLLAAATGDFTFPGFAALPHTRVRDAAFALLVLGFAVKVGLVPVHVWLPRGYRAAPGPLRAIMAGVAVNAGFYGLWRTLDLLHQPPPWLAVLVLLLGGATALLGIAHATVQTDLAEVVAYSSVENAGLITVGFGVALVGTAVGLAPLVAVGLLAATLQLVAHAIAKALLFTAVSGIEDATGTTTLDDLRGVGHRLRVSGTGLAIGALTLAGLPLTPGSCPSGSCWKR